MEIGQNSELHLTWKDGLVSKCDYEELCQKFSKHETQHVKYKTWTSDTFPSMEDTSVSFDKYMTSNEGLQKALKSLLENGFCFVSESPVSTDKGTKVVAERIGPIYRYLNTFSLCIIQI